MEPAMNERLLRYVKISGKNPMKWCGHNFKKTINVYTASISLCLISEALQGERCDASSRKSVTYSRNSTPVNGIRNFIKKKLN
jgi:hypothetical protein